ncbi:hypothetical protein MNKW57_22280 [Biformimicrobium ophioploci]|uniref:Uncharacterized protein n=1 Tax=Biformimicrobium ophioploci TaxID=3036711 RepID=A0ABQ6M0U3_9GAMM|nr:hypothetical protein MNKW57_22280 [Microbulbifer sp. NKW57]
MSEDKRGQSASSDPNKLGKGFMGSEPTALTPFRLDGGVRVITLTPSGPEVKGSELPL